MLFFLFIKMPPKKQNCTKNKMQKNVKQNINYYFFFLIKNSKSICFKGLSTLYVASGAF